MIHFAQLQDGTAHMSTDPATWLSTAGDFLLALHHNDHLGRPADLALSEDGEIGLRVVWQTASLLSAWSYWMKTLPLLEEIWGPCTASC